MTEVAKKFEVKDVMGQSSCASVGQKHGRIIKLLICGDSGAGKSCLLLRFCENEFNANYITTIGLDFKVKPMLIKDEACRVQVWDSAGQDRFRTLVSTYFRGAHGIMLCYDVTEEDSFHHVRNWAQQIDSYSNADIPRILVANKIDLVSERLITTEEGQRLADDYKLVYCETSAKSGQGVDSAFTKLAQLAFTKSQECAAASPTCNLNLTNSEHDKHRCMEACNRF